MVGHCFSCGKDSVPLVRAVVATYVVNICSRCSAKRGRKAGKR